MSESGRPPLGQIPDRELQTNVKTAFGWLAALATGPISRLRRTAVSKTVIFI